MPVYHSMHNSPRSSIRAPRRLCYSSTTAVPSIPVIGRFADELTVVLDDIGQCIYQGIQIMILLECAVERPQHSICCISGQDCVEIRQIIDLACDNHRIDDSQGLSFRTESKKRKTVVKGTGGFSTC